MNDQQIRMTCLEFALDHNHADTATEQVLDDAMRFYNFVWSGKVECGKPDGAGELEPDMMIAWPPIGIIQPETLTSI